MTESDSNDHRSSSDSLVCSDIDSSLVSLRLSLSTFSDSHESSLSKTDIEKKIDMVSDWVENQKKSSDEKSKKELIQNMGTFSSATVSGIEKMQKGDALGGTLDIISSVAFFTGEVIGGPAGAAVGAIIGTIYSIIGAIFAAKKPLQPSIVEQVAGVVHKELVEFNNKLQNQKYDGLKRRVSDQTAQLAILKRGDKLDDPDLWNDYVQFMGELGNRIQSPLPFKYEDNLAKDPDVADFVTAVISYCQAYSCFMALLSTAKGTFADLGGKHKKDEEAVDRKISGQIEDAKVKLAFLFDKRYLTFLGRLPSEGGKLTKIVAFSRNAEARHVVKMVTRAFRWSEILDLETVESKAEIVSRQFVKLKLEGHPALSGSFHMIQFINETQFPLKLCGTTPEKFTHVLQPRSSWYKDQPDFVYGAFIGYVIIFLDGKLHSDDETCDSDVTRVIEFALYRSVFIPGHRVNIQDKTTSELTKGQDTYEKLKDNKSKTIYWKTNETQYMACADSFLKPVPGPRAGTRSYFPQWRFVFQDFDPVRDVVLPQPTSNNCSLF